MKHHRVAGLVGAAAVLFLLSPWLTAIAEAQVNPVPKLPAKPVSARTATRRWDAESGTDRTE